MSSVVKVISRVVLLRNYTPRMIKTITPLYVMLGSIMARVLGRQRSSYQSSKQLLALSQGDAASLLELENGTIKDSAAEIRSAFPRLDEQ